MTEVVNSAYFFEYPQVDRFDMGTHSWSEENASPTVPCTPPWSTWSGRVHCSPDSWVGKRLLKDSNTIPLVFDKNGKSINNVNTEGYSNGIKAYGKEDWINGMWFAPNDWSTVSMDSGRTPDRKRVPDWVALKRYADASKKAATKKAAVDASE